jgi:hypothetical protein
MYISVCFRSRSSCSFLLIWLWRRKLPATEAKTNEKQQMALFEQIAKDAEALRLAENRALISAKLAEGLWRFDEKRARAFFQAQSAN